MTRLKTTLMALALAVPLMASAQSTPKFDQRQANQERRIEQGEQSGALTPKEAGRMERGQDRLQAKEDRVKADGTVTPHERERLQRAENRQSVRIYDQKHDRQHDFNHDGKVDRPARARS